VSRSYPRYPTPMNRMKSFCFFFQKEDFLFFFKKEGSYPFDLR
jgi:hypothetical protein